MLGLLDLSPDTSVISKIQDTGPICFNRKTIRYFQKKFQKLIFFPLRLFIIRIITIIIRM